MWGLPLNVTIGLPLLVAVGIHATHEAIAQGRYTGVMERTKYSSNIGVPSRYVRATVTYRKVGSGYQAKIGSVGFFPMTMRSGFLYGTTRVIRHRNGCNLQGALASDVPNRAKLRACVKFVVACGSYYQGAIYCGYLRRRR